MTDKDKIEILEKTVTELKILLDHYRAITAQYEKLSKPTYIPYTEPYRKQLDLPFYPTWPNIQLCRDTTSKSHE
jgi:hypothetical protein